MSGQDDAKGGEFRRGWPLVLASMLGIGLGLSPLPFYTTGVFAPHLAEEFGWSVGEIMTGITITSLVVLGAGPLAGFLATRFGARQVAMASLGAFGLSIMLLGLSSKSIVLYYLTWALIAAAGAGTLPITWTRAVNAAFQKRKGLALGLSMMGTGLFGIVSKPLTNGLIEQFGWRGAYVGLGLLPLLIGLPIAYFLFREPAVSRSRGNAAVRAGGLSFAQAIRDWRFWVIAAALLPISFALAGPLPNMEKILSEAGFGPATIIKMTPLIGLSALTGRVVGGWLLDRFWAPAVSLCILTLPGVSCWVLTQSHLAEWQAVGSILLLGFAVGVEYDLIAFLVARYFGMRAYSSIYGVIYVFFSLGAGVGPAVFGYSFDKTGSYSTALIASFFALIISALALLTLGRYRDFKADAADVTVLEHPDERTVAPA